MTNTNEEWYRKFIRLDGFMVGDKIRCIRNDDPAVPGDIAVVSHIPPDLPDFDVGREGITERMRVIFGGGEWFMRQDKWELV